LLLLANLIYIFILKIWDNILYFCMEFM
jgi:hypothetical protein